MGFFDFVVDPVGALIGNSIGLPSPSDTIMGLLGGGGGGGDAAISALGGQALGGMGSNDKDKQNQNKIVDPSANYGFDKPDSIFNQYRKQQMGMGGQTGG